MNQELKDYLIAKLKRAEMWCGCCNKEDKKFYQGQIVAYRNVYKKFESQQCNIHDVVVPKGTLCDLDGKEVMVKFKVTKHIPKIFIEDI